MLQRVHLRRNDYIPVKEIVKSYKENYRDRASLNQFYTAVLTIYNLLCKSLEDDFHIKINHISSDERTFQIAEGFMRNYQLEIKDALHLAAAYNNKATHFATLDSDFVHQLYTEDIGDTTILHISKRHV
ncbi:PIN domain-containing protein [Bacillus sp. N1-1]|nr:PIN domain-containing protein [Bacillus sp. N1-1]